MLFITLEVVIFGGLESKIEKRGLTNQCSELISDTPNIVRLNACAPNAFSCRITATASNTRALYTNSHKHALHLLCVELST